ncbi:uncharacterized protein LOC125029551 [Penaeus chinensis]|uniref:uncharacterized protein LOC125029551 n=1 Tax=Penaeus chinensis TaxID=139456 RepID=UPI001FB6B20B|nr:uncharacterized protein LOC125029551 [Penaeus chinensis]
MTITIVPPSKAGHTPTLLPDLQRHRERESGQPPGTLFPGHRDARAPPVPPPAPPPPPPPPPSRDGEGRPWSWRSRSSTQGAPRSDTGFGQLVRIKRKAIDSTHLWPDALVPYTFQQPEPDRQIVKAALAHWENHTCLRFQAANDTNFPHLQFRKLSGCRSGVGIEGTGGQNISIGDNCNKLGIVVHEVGHAVGFYHEIRRPDRDEHVVVNEKNILKDERFNFYKLHWLDVSIKYDLSSVMHYNTLEWSANERTTVATKDPMLQGLIGMWKRETYVGLSHRDKLLANTIYGCLDTWLAKCNLNRNPCKNEGYLGEGCTCICPPGSEGRLCEIVTGGYYDHLKSPCSVEVTYPTVITSPNYPNHYDAGTWCVYRLQGEECHAPEITIHDFQMGPRDFRDQCFHDYLEIRNDTLYDGVIKCGTDVARGTRWVASSNTMILYFKGEEGGHRGFKATVSFNPIPGCCRTHTNSSAFFLHTPGYPNPYNADFHCTYAVPPEAPAKVVVSVVKRGGGGGGDQWTCSLRLCQPHGRCNRHCRGLRKQGLSQEQTKEVVLPNVASLHHLQYSGDPPLFNAEYAAYQVAFVLEESPCHKILTVNRTEPQGWITVGPRFFELVQCEWWIEAARGSHVKLSIVDLQLPVHEDSYLVVNEAGESSYPPATTRVYPGDGGNVPKSCVSLEHKLSVVLQGDFITEVTLKYELYECIDKDEECEYWAVNGECEKNPLWMKVFCKKSCLQCEFTTLCDDNHNDCEFWASHDQCEENYLWMQVHCKRSCGRCDECWDANILCPEWANLGECEGNPSYMNRFCRKSCGLCLNLIATTAKPSAGLTSAPSFLPTVAGPRSTTTTTTTTTATPPTLTPKRRPGKKVPSGRKEKDDKENETSKPSKNKVTKTQRKPDLEQYEKNDVNRISDDKRKPNIYDQKPHGKPRVKKPFSKPRSPKLFRMNNSVVDQGPEGGRPPVNRNLLKGNQTLSSLHNRQGGPYRPKKKPDQARPNLKAENDLDQGPGTVRGERTRHSPWQSKPRKGLPHPRPTTTPPDVPRHSALTSDAVSESSEETEGGNETLAHGGDFKSQGLAGTKHAARNEASVHPHACRDRPGGYICGSISSSNSKGGRANPYMKRNPNKSIFRRKDNTSNRRNANGTKLHGGRVQMKKHKRQKNRGRLHNRDNKAERNVTGRGFPLTHKQKKKFKKGKWRGRDWRHRSRHPSKGGQRSKQETSQVRKAQQAEDLEQEAVRGHRRWNRNKGRQAGRIHPKKHKGRRPGLNRTNNSTAHSNRTQVPITTPTPLKTSPHTNISVSTTEATFTTTLTPATTQIPLTSKSSQVPSIPTPTGPSTLKIDSLTIDTPTEDLLSTDLPIVDPSVPQTPVPDVPDSVSPRPSAPTNTTAKPRLMTTTPRNNRTVPTHRKNKHSRKKGQRRSSHQDPNRFQPSTTPRPFAKNATVPPPNNRNVAEEETALAPQGEHPHRHNHHGKRGRRRKTDKDDVQHNRNKKGAGHRFDKLDRNATHSGQQRHRDGMRKVGKNKHKYKADKRHGNDDSVARPGEGRLRVPHHHNQDGEESNIQDGLDDQDDDQGTSSSTNKESPRMEEEDETITEGQDDSEPEEDDRPLEVDGSRGLHFNAKKHAKDRHGPRRNKPNTLNLNSTSKPPLRRKGKHFLKRTGKTGNPRYGKSRRNKEAPDSHKKNGTIATARPNVIVTGSPGLHEQSRASGRSDITENQVLSTVKSGHHHHFPKSESHQHEEAEEEPESNAVLPFDVVDEDWKNKQEMQLDATSTVSSLNPEKLPTQTEAEKDQEDRSESKINVENVGKGEMKNTDDILEKEDEDEAGNEEGVAEGSEDEGEDEKAEAEASEDEEEADEKADTEEANENEHKTEETLDLEMTEDEDTAQERAPRRSPEKYAEWGIGPLRPPHRSSRRSRPGWRFQKTFYRRGHVYEDIRRKEKSGGSDFIARPSLQPPIYETRRG